MSLCAMNGWKQAKTSSQELDALREEYQQRVGAAERKVLERK